MTLFAEKEYDTNIEDGERFLNSAEIYYENCELEKAIIAYYHASINFETAKEIAKLGADVQLTIKAKDKEFYCLEKIDELETFKKTNLDDLSR